MSADIQQKFSFALLKRVLSYAKPYTKMFFFASLTAILLAAISIVRPILTRFSIDDGILKHNEQMLLKAVLWMVGFLLLETALQFGNEYLSGWLGQTIIRDMRTKLFHHINHFQKLFNKMSALFFVHHFFQ